MAAAMPIHGTALWLAGRGLVILGPPGAGKSRLALALLERAGALDPLHRLPDDACLPRTPATAPLERTPAVSALIGDDRLHLQPGTPPHVVPAPGLEGLLEVRGLGIVAVPWVAQAPLHAVLRLCAPDTWPRMPERTTEAWAGADIPCLHLPSGDLAHQVLLADIGLRL